jgi:RNA polymerase sigma factor for flagellar operon FliA
MMTPQTKQEAPKSISNEVLRAKISQAYARQSREASEERMILENLPLVKHIARKIASNMASREDLEDLISAGTLGLVQAAKSYNPEANAEFRTYAYIRIRGSILDELRSRSFVPSSAHKMIRQVREAYQRLISQTGSPPEDATLAREVGLTTDQLMQVFVEARKQQFLSIHGLNEEEHSVQTLMPLDRSASPDSQAERKEQLLKMAEAIRSLPEKERLVLLLYYERDLTMKEIAEVLELTESRISQLHAAALFKMAMKLR